MPSPSLSTATLRRISHDLACRSRAVDRLVSSDDFDDAYSPADTDARLAAAELIRSSDRDGLEDWLRLHRPVRGHEDMTLRELRAVGQQLGIRSYNHLPKAILLSEIVHATKRPGAEAPQIAR